MKFLSKTLFFILGALFYILIKGIHHRLSHPPWLRTLLLKSVHSSIDISHFGSLTLEALLEDLYANEEDEWTRELRALNNNDTKNTEKLLSTFYKLTSFPLQRHCRSLKRLGGKWIPTCSFVDGDKWVCMEDVLTDLNQGTCVVYSFGINNEWSFDDALARIGCQVYSFDPSMNIVSHQRSQNLKFYDLGISDKSNKKLKMMSLDDIFRLTNNPTKSATYLKIDIEGAEIGVMNALLRSESLRNVKQIAMEWHTSSNRVSVGNYLRILKGLTDKGFVLISYEVNGCFGRRAKSRSYGLFEVVFRKIYPG